MLEQAETWIAATLAIRMSALYVMAQSVIAMARSA